MWFDLIYLQRYNPHLRPFFEWVGFGTTFAETASAADHGAILEMVERHEGSLSAAIARYWLERQPDAFLTVRSVTGELIGFVCHLRLEAATPEDMAVDPAVANAVAHMERYGPPGAGEHTVYARFLMHRERYQAQVLAPVAASCSQNWTAPGLAWCFIAVADPDLMEPLFTELHIWRVRDADFEVGGRRYGVFAHDWRVENAEQWLRLKAERAWRIEIALIPSLPKPEVPHPFRHRLACHAFARHPHRIRSRSPPVPKDFCVPPAASSLRLRGALAFTTPCGREEQSMDLSRTVAVPQPRPVTGGRAWSHSRSPRFWRSGSSSKRCFRISGWIRRRWLATGRDAGGCWRTSPRAPSHC